MNRTDYARLEIQHCPSCGGNYVDESTFRSIQKRREAKVTGPDVPQMRPGSEEPVRCPRCNLEMLKLPYTEGSSITVDKCRSCQGYWFDVGELEAVQVVYRNKQDEARREKARAKAQGRKPGRRNSKILRWGVVVAVLAVVALAVACLSAAG
jgi:Zn-finger nucleic acid-binding protein